MLNRSDFFANKESAESVFWEAAVSFNRKNPTPLERYSVFPSIEDARAYIEGPLAYPGQVLAVVYEDTTKVYFIDYNVDKSAYMLKEITAGGSSSSSSSGAGFNLEEDL